MHHPFMLNGSKNTDNLYKKFCTNYNVYNITTFVQHYNLCTTNTCSKIHLFCCWLNTRFFYLDHTSRQYIRNSIIQWEIPLSVLAVWKVGWCIYRRFITNCEWRYTLCSFIRSYGILGVISWKSLCKVSICIYWCSPLFLSIQELIQNFCIKQLSKKIFFIEIDLKLDEFGYFPSWFFLYVQSIQLLKQ